MINQPTHQNWLFIRVVNRVQSTNSHGWLFVWLIISAMIRQWLFNQPARVIDYSTMIEPHWWFVINQPTHQNWLFIRVVNRVQSTNSHDWLFVVNRVQSTNWLFASSRDWLFDNDWVTLIIHASSQSSSINQLIRSQSSSIDQLAGLIIRVIDYSAMIRLAWVIIRQWLFNRV